MVCGVPGSDATSIAESVGVSPRSPDRSADARSAGHVPGPGVLAAGKRLAAPAAGRWFLSVCPDRSRTRTQGRLR